MIALFGAGGEMLLGKARSREQRDLDLAQLLASRDIVDEVWQRGVIRWESHSLAHPVVLGLGSASGLKPLAMGRIEVGCVGVREQLETCGLVYLDRGRDGEPFRRETLQMVEWLAQLISVAVTRKLEGTWRWRFLDATKRYSPSRGR
ncbi:MAG: hypothetical protein AAF657_03000 [Acidobacteriota bacterium]